MMDPISLGIGAVGLGMKLFGGFGASSNASQIASISAANAQLEGQVQQQKYQAMQLSSRRQQLEDFRNTQRARAQGIAAATNQGAQYGSGLAGGVAATTAQGMFNVQGINQNLQIGQNIFGLDQQISNNNAQISALQGSEATDQGWASLGGSLMSSAGTISGIAKSAPGIVSSFGKMFS